MTVVTCPTSGPISIANVKAAFPTTNSNNLNDYRGKQWFKDNNDRGYFPGNNSAISLSDFYGKRENSPVTPGGPVTITSGTSYTLPSMFNTLTVAVYAGGGGGGGGGYVKSYGEVYSGAAGGGGGNTTFGTSGASYYLGATGGGGGGGGSSVVTNYYGAVVADGTGAIGSPNLSGGGSGGGAGSGLGAYTNGRTDIYKLTQVGATGGAGGTGGSSSGVVLDITALGYDAIKAFYGASIPISVGGAGSRGTAGNQGGTFAGFGSAGGAGYIVISWT